MLLQAGADDRECRGVGQQGWAAGAGRQVWAGRTWPVFLAAFATSCSSTWGGKITPSISREHCRQERMAGRGGWPAACMGAEECTGRVVRVKPGRLPKPKQAG